VGDKPKLLVIAGPTASGKTSFAVNLAVEFEAEIVGADSMQVYRGLDIGTAKPSTEELKGVAHHLMDLVNPDESFDAARFVEEADRAIADISGRGKRVIVAGGTGLYLRALLHGLHQGPASTPEIRAEINDRAKQEGWPALHAELLSKDPKIAQRLHPNDGVRIGRALEVFQASGVPMSEWQRRHAFSRSRYESLIMGIEWQRDELNQKIEKRTQEMMDAGLLKEVKSLLAAGWGSELKPMQGLGYRRLCEHLAGELSLEEAVEKIKTDTRRFAKRQMTWFKKEPGLEWVAPSDKQIKSRAEEFWK
jgi:tRNA dimethylallyltransferase